jgi:phage-related protein
MNWTITYYSEALQEDIIALPAGLLGRYLRYTDRMEIYGPDLGMPHTRAMGNGLFELRLEASEGVARVFYCTMIGKKIVILHQFTKKTQKTPPKELALARRRMKEVKDADTQRT